MEHIVDPEILFDRVTGAAAIAKTFDPGAPFKLHGFKLHLSAVGGAADLTVTTDATAGAVYDTLVYCQDMTSMINIIEIFEKPIPFAKDDKVIFAWANGSTRTYGLEILYSLL